MFFLIVCIRRLLLRKFLHNTIQMYSLLCLGSTFLLHKTKPTANMPARTNSRTALPHAALIAVALLAAVGVGLSHLTAQPVADAGDGAHFAIGRGAYNPPFCVALYLAGRLGIGLRGALVEDAAQPMAAIGFDSRMAIHPSGEAWS